MAADDAVTKTVVSSNSWHLWIVIIIIIIINEKINVAFSPKKLQGHVTHTKKDDIVLRQLIVYNRGWRHFTNVQSCNIDLI